MTYVAPWPILSVAAVLVAMVSVHVGSHFAIIRRLKRYHPFEWSEIGEPPLFSSMSVPRYQPARDYLASGAYRALNDHHLDSLVRLKRRALHIAIAIYVLLVVSRFILRHV